MSIPSFCSLDEYVSVFNKHGRITLIWKVAVSDIWLLPTELNRGGGVLSSGLKHQV
jgi:hypothetical protein